MKWSGEGCGEIFRSEDEGVQRVNGKVEFGRRENKGDEAANLRKMAVFFFQNLNKTRVDDT